VCTKFDIYVFISKVFEQVKQVLVAIKPKGINMISKILVLLIITLFRNCKFQLINIDNKPCRRTDYWADATFVD